jgi:hypothetical protein
MSAREADPVADTDPPERTGADAILRALLHSTFGLFPDDVHRVVAELVAEHSTATDVELLLVDLDQEELNPLGAGESRSVEWSAAGQAFREEQPVWEDGPDGRRYWLPILDSAERLGVLGLVGGEEVPIDDWLAVASCLGEMIVSKEAYGDKVAVTRRRKPVSLAAEMRWWLLPPLTFTSPTVSITGILQPSYRVAGDAFDYAVSLEKAEVGVFDAVGHDLRAARLANLAVGGFRSGRRAGLDTAATLAFIDDAIHDQFGGAAFVTGQIITLDLHSGELSIRTAGHPPPVRFRPGGSPEVLQVQPGVPLGLGADGYPERQASLEPGDLVLLLSDGAYEGRSQAGEPLGMERLLAMVQDRIDAEDRPPEVLRRVMREVLMFQGPGEVRDDTTLALLRWRPEVVGLPTRPRASELHQSDAPPQVGA